MAIKKLFAVSAISLAVGFLSTSAVAEEGEGIVEEYVTNPYGEVYKNSYGECWRDRFQSTDVKLEECGYAPEVVVVEEVAVVTCEDQLVVSDVNFAFDSAELTEAAKAGLADEVAHVRRINTGECDRVTGARIVGHTDSIGPAEYNQQLSERRAIAVRDYLQTHEGVTQDMEAIGMGETDPIADNNTAEGRAQNRRVVIELLYN